MVFIHHTYNVLVIACSMAVSWASLMELLLPGGTAHFSDGIGSPGAG